MEGSRIVNRAISNKHLSFKDTLVIGFALFAMFFGAGNLIFPVMAGADAGFNVSIVTCGLLLTSVALPVLGIIVVSSETEAESARGGVPSRIGKIPGVIFTFVVFLTTGMLYALPRVATVAYEMSAAPLLVQSKMSAEWKLFIFTLLFFAVTIFFVLSPSSVVSRVGKYLSPALLVFLALLVLVAVIVMPNLSGVPTAKWTNAPFVTGVIEGYNTMDALAAFVFGGVIVQSLKKHGADTPKKRMFEMAKVGLVAGACLALVYIGLTVVGTRQAGLGFENGAKLLAAVSGTAFGSVGQIVFSVITILACLTTAIGLLTAATKYYKNIIPCAPYVVLVVVQVAISVSLANLGLTQILAIVGPLMQFIYPVAITIITLALLERLMPFRLDFTYKMAAATAAVIAFFEAGRLAFADSFAFISPLVDIFPLAGLQMAWMLPTLIMAGLGIVIDMTLKQPVRH